MCDFVGLRMVGIEISQHDDSQPVVHISRDLRGETLPSSPVLDQLVAIHLGHSPSESVGV